MPIQLKPLDGLIAQWFTPESEKAAEEKGETPSKFKIKPLDGLTFLDAMSNGVIQADGSFIPNKAGRSILLNNGLVGWENIAGIEFSQDKIKQLPFDVLAEICGEIIVKSTLSDQDEKN